MDYISRNLKGLLLDFKKSFFGVRLSTPMSKTIMLALMGVLTALSIAFERVVYIPVGDTSRYSLTFMMTAVCCVSLGALRGAVVAVLADVIGAIIVYGNANPLLTICLCLSALTYGLILYCNQSIVRIVIAVLIDQLIISLILKTGALSVWYYGISQYFKVFGTRVPQVLIMIPIQIVVLIVFSKFIFKYLQNIVKEYVEK